MPRKHVYRPGDIVQVVKPQIVRRVGYPLEIRELALTLHEQHRLKIQGFLMDIAGFPIGVPDYNPLGRILLGMPETEMAELPSDGMGYKRFMERLAYIIADSLHFGGKDRQLHHTERPDLDGQLLYVHSKRRVNTGRYYSAGGSYDDYEPGGLHDMKGHVLLECHRYYPATPNYPLVNAEDLFEIEEANVTPAPAQGEQP